MSDLVTARTQSLLITCSRRSRPLHVPQRPASLASMLARHRRWRIEQGLEAHQPSTSRARLTFVAADLRPRHRPRQGILHRERPATLAALRCTLGNRLSAARTSAKTLAGQTSLTPVEREEDAADQRTAHRESDRHCEQSDRDGQTHQARNRREDATDHQPSHRNRDGQPAHQGFPLPATQPSPAAVSLRPRGVRARKPIWSR